MEEENVKNVQIKQEYLIYGLAGALIVIIILVGSLLYIITNQSSGPEDTGGIGSENMQLPPGHVPIREGAVPGPLDPSQMPADKQGEDGATSGQTDSKDSATGNKEAPANPAPPSGTGK